MMEVQRASRITLMCAQRHGVFMSKYFLPLRKCLATSLVCAEDTATEWSLPRALPIPLSVALRSKENVFLSWCRLQHPTEAAHY